MIYLNGNLYGFPEVSYIHFYFILYNISNTLHYFLSRTIISRIQPKCLYTSPPATGRLLAVKVVAHPRESIVQPRSAVALLRIFGARGLSMQHVTRDPLQTSPASLLFLPTPHTIIFLVPVRVTL